ncbi:putative RDD family membrane protein YckC [Evansella vedderi]|uniref:RDD family membrane protein YckC n=1 Tax=Evansella vedderi TaxID=38282 RepID=A0ABT9ZN78_9BACI|nr:RDD family protein [Evansella vedderi]MDQ0252649.1 putative RDD family membrane protein YckC [Evansella vedderi]
MEAQNSAGFWVRLGAAILDGIFISLVLGVISLIVYGQIFVDASPLDLLALLYYLILPVVWYGYTLGKRALGIRIARIDGEKVTIGTMLLRDIVGGLVYAVTLGIGLIVSAFMVGLREDNRAIHDFIAGTYVTYDPPEYD